MPHEDGAAYYPLVATVSLGAAIVLDLYEKKQQQESDDGGRQQQQSQPQAQPRFRILQEPRSLLVTRKKIYTDFRHGIAERTRDEHLSAATVCNWDLLRDRQRFEECDWYDRETRTSLTYRDVLKVTKLGNTMKYLSGR